MYRRVKRGSDVHFAILVHKSVQESNGAEDHSTVRLRHKPIDDLRLQDGGAQGGHHRRHRLSDGLIAGQGA